LCNPNTATRSSSYGFKPDYYSPEFKAEIADLSETGTLYSASTMVKVCGVRQGLKKLSLPAFYLKSNDLVIKHNKNETKIKPALILPPVAPQ